MFQWVDKPGLKAGGRLQVNRMYRPFLLGMVPLFLSAFLFLSVLFAIFSPLPLLLLHFKGRWWKTALAITTNTAIIFYLSTPLSAAVYFSCVVVLSVVLAECLNRKISLEWSSIASFLSVVVTVVLMVLIYSKYKNLVPWVEVRQEVSALAHYMVQTLTKEGATGSWINGGISGGMGVVDLEELKQKIIFDMPSTLAILVLITIWVNLLVVLRLNPSGFKEKRNLDSRYTKNWKVPENLVWPTLLAGALLLKDFGWPTIVALNAFKVFMALYAVQGLSILSYFFDLWGLYPTFRVAGYAFAVLAALPLVLSLGFFDLWFDFRNKFRQS